MGDLYEYTPTMGHKGWDGHVDDVISLLTPLISDQGTPEEIMVYQDLMATQICPAHVVVLLSLMQGALRALDFTVADLHEATRGLRGRPAATVPFPVDQ